MLLQKAAPNPALQPTPPKTAARLSLDVLCPTATHQQQDRVSGINGTIRVRRKIRKNGTMVGDTQVRIGSNYF